MTEWTDLLGDFRPGFHGWDGQPVSFDEWSEIYRAGVHVADDYVRRGDRLLRISTVLVGYNHSFVPGSRPVIFETMIFEDESLGGIYQERYCTLQQARAGHRRALRMVWRIKAGHRRLIHKGRKP